MTAAASITHNTVILTPEGRKEAREHVAIETPYTITLNDIEIGASMVLPTGLEEFGVGFLFGQGYIQTPAEVKEVIVCPEGRIAVYADVESTEPKNVIISSGCGGTGKIPRDMLEGHIGKPHELTISFTEIKDFIRQVLQASPLGPMTHCVHGCGLWADGHLQAFFEDVGRHNAVDKIMGAILLGKASPRAAIYTTGRLTSDMVLKCARMKIPVVMSRTAASSLGLAIAARAGLTLAAYSRPERLNIFHAPERITS
ncbi:MAG: formate dehydrogenase accessory sulfurtransferase FdhD [Desulfocapsaceae bacterium]|jgi:FdhD protein|nr:formate dehydrogenase accessory sulfurtransferase FdhD [Desulfocapsaceae bacterium]